MIRVVLTLALLAIASPSLALAQARTPYLQRATDTGMHVVWRSAAPQISRVCYGTSMSSLGSTAGSGLMETDHDASIGSLTASTRYYYAVALASCSASTTGTATDWFETSPAPGSTGPFRLWVVGDSGTGDANQVAVRDAMLSDTAARAPDLFLHMGDIAYNSGTTAEFDAHFFAIYAEILRHTPVWPTLGNHEAMSSSSATETGPYYEAYSLPTDGAAGGVASGTEAYYSFDYGNAHFIVLNSQDVSRAPGSAMFTWLESDLSATDQEWQIAYFHHPPYTHGSHNSDVEIQHVQMREVALPILEAHGVDVVLGGHSHIYERSFLAHGGYDTPTTSAGHIVDPGDGRLDGDGPYASGAGGTLYVTAGHGGAGTSGAGDHPMMFFSEVANGSCVVDVDGGSLTLRNIRRDGTETDHVTLVRAHGLTVLSPAGGSSHLAGSIVPIAWTTSDATTTMVRIEGSLDGASWFSIVDTTANDGAFDWTTPRRVAAMARVRVTDVADMAISGTSGPFSLVSTAISTVIPLGDVWEYSADGTDRSDTWRDGSGGPWPEGAAELGYGDGDEVTLLPATPVQPTYYFRRAITVDGAVTSARLTTRFDDGIAVWINGQLVFTRDVDAGLDYATFATGGTDDNEMATVDLDLSMANPFVTGENWIAVIVKQVDAGSSDLSFDLSLDLGITVMVDPDPTDGGVDSDAGSSIRSDGGTLRDGSTTPAPADGGCGCVVVGGGPRQAPASALALAVLLAAGISARRRRACR